MLLSSFPVFLPVIWEPSLAPSSLSPNIQSIDWSYLQMFLKVFTSLHFTAPLQPTSPSILAWTASFLTSLPGLLLHPIPWNSSPWRSQKIFPKTQISLWYYPTLDLSLLESANCLPISSSHLPLVIEPLTFTWANGLPAKITFPRLPCS